MKSILALILVWITIVSQQEILQSPIIKELSFNVTNSSESQIDVAADIDITLDSPPTTTTNIINNEPPTSNTINFLPPTTNDISFDPPISEFSNIFGDIGISSNYIANKYQNEGK